MKKEMVTLLLASALLASSLTACDKVEAAKNHTDNTTTVPSIVQTTPQNAENDKVPSPDSTSPSFPEPILNTYREPDFTYEINSDNLLYINIKDLEQPNIDTIIEYTIDLGELTLGDEAPDIFCNFISPAQGYIFVFYEGISEIDGNTAGRALCLIFSTEDAGQTWKEIHPEYSPHARWNEEAQKAKFLSEKVGFVSFRHHADDDISKRTYITTDGGKNWFKVILPSHYPEVDFTDNRSYVFSGEAYDLVYKNGKYVLCLRAKNYDSDGRYYYDYFEYSSIDLINWTFIEK